MTTIESLTASRDKAQANVTKIESTITRHKTQLDKKLAKIAPLGITLENMEEKKWLGGAQGTGGSEHYWKIVEVERKLDDIKGAEKKLKTANETLANWQNKLDKEVEKKRFIEGNAPQVIKDFLEEWKRQAYEWYVQRYERYLKLEEELKLKAFDARKYCIFNMPEYAERYLENGKLKSYYEEDNFNNVFPSKPMEDYLKEKKLDYRSIKAKLAYFAGSVVLKMDEFINDSDRFAWLDKTLEEEKKNKMSDLINRINEKVGTITDASLLRISQKGNIDGFVDGEKGRAKIQTVPAEGEIQRFHYRTLVHLVK